MMMLWLMGDTWEALFTLDIILNSCPRTGFKVFMLSDLTSEHFQRQPFQMLVAGQTLPRASFRLFAASLSKTEKICQHLECHKDPVLSAAKSPSSRFFTTSAAFLRGEGGYSRREAKRKFKGRLEYLNRPDPCEQEDVARVEDDLQEWQVGEGQANSISTGRCNHSGAG